MKQENKLEKQTKNQVLNYALVPGSLFYYLGKNSKENKNYNKYELYMGALMGELAKGTVFASGIYEFLIK